ncbi:hypothetical protein SAMN05443579_110157 [Variovorax sp. PDC80]|uniref:hypothetical protein n=1 Tax=Variovorax sp. PDC80 TaxID=1882827 RepID=UPI0008E8C1B5|nr:hypothetical protein [Variovorax sp. PDC80]SFP31711.1 hypothetical protein SAMN05443579_110157 [Variovorax sp. PDC80]
MMSTLPTPPRQRLEATADSVLSLIQAQAFEHALRALNAAVPHRFTAIFKVDGDQVRNVLLIDKLGQPRPERFAVFPLADSFCRFVLRDAFLHVEDSSQEALLDGSPYQGMIRAYHAVALTLLDARVVGTLSHFDTAPQKLDDADFGLLVLAARTLPDYLVNAAIWD